MSVVPRALPLAFCLISAIGPIQAQTAELPPIFAPRPVAKESAEPVANRAPSRMRAQLNEAILALVAVTPAPTAAADEAGGSPTVTADGVVMMKRFLVKSVAPSANEISPPPALRLLHFAPVERAARRTKPAWQMPLLHLAGGYLHLDVVNGGGQGLDHGRDFTRAELGFTKRF
ncbi:MAG: hypothetical protein Q8N18_17055 [Opitutaceae bacterium]|nr:hypothetical protein [Opitutaceae bacterium]